MQFYKTLLFARFLGFVGVALFGIGGYYCYHYGPVYFQFRRIAQDGSPNPYAELGLQLSEHFFGSVAIVIVGVLLMIASTVLGYLRQLWIQIAALPVTERSRSQ